MKDPCCVLSSFADTKVLDGRVKHPGWWGPLIENCENWFKKRDQTFENQTFGSIINQLYGSVCCDACDWFRPSFSPIDSH